MPGYIILNFRGTLLHDINPCPFCGKEFSISGIPLFSANVGVNTIFQLECTECAGSITDNNIDNLRTKWNSRCFDAGTTALVLKTPIITNMELTKQDD